MLARARIETAAVAASRLSDAYLKFILPKRLTRSDKSNILETDETIRLKRDGVKYNGEATLWEALGITKSKKTAG